MNITSILCDIGLSEKEAAVYCALLELQEAVPSVIARKAEIKRPTTYIILEQLQKRGIVSRFTRGKNLFYRSLSPQSLLEEQRRTCAALEKALPEMAALQQKYGARPQMSLFEGKDGLIKIMEDTLTTHTELFCWADVGESVSCLRDYYPTYIAKKVQRKIWVRGVVCYDKMALCFKKHGADELRELYLIPKEKFPFKNEINIYDDKVAIISHEDKIGVIIQNQNIADTQRSIFNLGFEYAKILEQDVLTAKDKKYLAA